MLGSEIERRAMKIWDIVRENPNSLDSEKIRVQCRALVEDAISREGDVLRAEIAKNKENLRTLRTELKNARERVKKADADVFDYEVGRDTAYEMWEKLF